MDFCRMKQQLRQLSHHPNSVTKGDIFSLTEEKSVSRGEDLSYEAWVAYRNKQKQPTGAVAASRSSSKGGTGEISKSLKGAQEKNGFNRRTGERDRCYGCGSEYHLLPKCPTKQERKAPAPALPPSSTPRSSFSSITSEDSPQDANSAQHPFSTSLTKDRPVFMHTMTVWRFWTLEPRPIWCALTGCPIAMNY